MFKGALQSKLGKILLYIQSHKHIHTDTAGMDDLIFAL